MAFPRRHLIRRAAALLGLLAFGLAHGAPAPEKPPQFRVLALGDPTLLQDIHYDFGNLPTELQSSDISLSPLYDRKAEDKALTLYRKVAAVPPDTLPGRLPLTSVKLESPLGLVVLKASDAKVFSTAFDDSWTAFPPGNVRIISFSRRKIAAQVEDDQAEVSPSTYHLFKYPEGKPRIRIKIASRENDGWQMCFNNSQAIIPGCRVNIVLHDPDPTPEDPNPRHLVVTKIVDPLLPPPPAAASPAR